jgi:predicted phage tail protein
MIILYGYLRKKFGKKVDAEVSSVSELMKAVEANRPGFRSYIERDRSYVIRRGSEFKKGKDISDDELDMTFDNKTWHVLPLPHGYKKAGLFQTILGVALVVVGVITQQYQLAWAGAAMALGGVAQMLAPSPLTNYNDRDDPDSRASYLFDGPINRVAAGGAVPIVYGKDVFIGSVFVSGGIHVGDLSAGGEEDSGKWDAIIAEIG